MKKIALLSDNKIVFEDIEKYVMPILYKPYVKADFKILNKKLDDYIWSVVSAYVKIVEIDTMQTDLLGFICEFISNPFNKNPDELFYFTENSYSSPKSHLEVIFAKDYSRKSENNNINNLGCFFSLKHTVIEKNCVIMANTYDLENKSTYVKNIDITPRDIIRVIRRRFFQTAILIKKDKLIKYYYQNPVGLIGRIFNLNIQTDNIQTLSFSYLNYNLTLCSLKDDNAYVNEAATRICGHNLIRGDTLVICEQEEKIQASISIKEIQQLNLLAYGKLADRELKETETFIIYNNTESENNDKCDNNSDNNSDNNPDKHYRMLWTKHLIRLNRLKEKNLIKNQCICCNNKITKRIVCNHCFRAKYCSEECQKKDFVTEHFKECIYSDKI